MIVYRSKRNIFEPESEYDVDGEHITWRREGRPARQIRLAEVKDIRLSFADGALIGGNNLWQAVIRPRSGTPIKAVSVSYLGVGRTQSREREFFTFLRTLHTAVAVRSTAAPPIRTGDPTVMGLWILVLIGLGLLLPFAVLVLVGQLSEGAWGSAGFAALVLLGMVGLVPIVWRSLNANRARVLDLG